MFKAYPDDQVVRGVLRAYPEGGEGYTAIDIGCGTGRHTKLLLDLGFSVKAIAWNFLYAYNHTVNDCLERIKKIHDLLKPNGKALFSLKSTDDIFNRIFKKDCNGLINNTVYNVPGNIFLSKKEVVQLMDKVGFDIDYLEKFSRSHTLNWKELCSNKEWETTNLELFEDWYAVCAVKNK